MITAFNTKNRKKIQINYLNLFFLFNNKKPKFGYILFQFKAEFIQHF